MATVSIINDVRRTDQRTSVLENPYWITSGPIDASATTAIDDKYVVVFSFPTAGEIIIVQEVLIEVTTVFTAGSTCTLGYATLATDAVTTGGVATTVDDDDFCLAADVTLTTVGTYGPTTANTSDWLTARAAGTYAAPRVITGAATAVPAVILVAANAGSIAAGVCRVHMLITKKP